MKRLIGSGLLVALLLGVSACRRPGPPVADQTPPKGTNGIVWRNGELWIADVQGDQIVVADPVTGAITARYGADQGVTGKPDDLVIGRDGTVYWTGFGTGIIGRMRPGQKGEVLATIAPDVNPIAFGPDGQLYVARAMNSDGFYKVDPRTGQVTQIAESLGNVNAFAFGRDGQLYAPRMTAGEVVRIDPATGTATTLATGLPQADALRFKPNRLGQLDYATAYVLSAYPVALRRVDLATGAVTVVKETLPNPVGDNLAFAPDGRTFVTAYNRPSVSVIAADGTVTTLAIGRATAETTTTTAPTTAAPPT